MKNLVPYFTKDEMDILVSKCNFTQSELELFWLREQEYTLEECAERMNLSCRTVIRLNKHMNQKILKVSIYFFKTPLNKYVVP